MKESRLKQAMHYKLSEFGWSSLYVYGIAIVAIVVIGRLVTINIDDSSFSAGLGGVGFIHFLIIGISGIRQDLKFFIQHGVSRRTTFFSNFYGSLICSTALGLFCVLFDIVVYHVTGFNYNSAAFTVQSFFTGWVTHTVAFFAAWQVGAFVSLIYYRLGKMQRIVFTVGIIAVVVFGFTSGVRLLSDAFDDLGDIISSLVENGLGFITLGIWAGLVFGLLASIGNYLLVRRVQIT